MKTAKQIFRVHYTDTSVPILESQVLAAMEEYANQFKPNEIKSPCKQHYLVPCGSNGKIADSIRAGNDYSAICIKCGYRP